MQKLSGRKLLLIGFTLFSMFFGAGNLIFPPDLGAKAGIHFWPAFLGLAISAVGLPVAGVVAVARPRVWKSWQAGCTRCLPGLYDPDLPVHWPLPGHPTHRQHLLCHAGPLVPPGPGCSWDTRVGVLAAAFLVALQPEKLTRWLGRLLCPCLLVLILVLFGGCLLHPLAGQYGTPTPEYTSGAVYRAYCMATRPWTPGSLELGAIIA